MPMGIVMSQKIQVTGGLGHDDLGKGRTFLPGFGLPLLTSELEVRFSWVAHREII